MRAYPTQPYGRLVVIELVHVDGHHHSQFLCACVCGAQVVVTECALLAGATRSCGCLQREQARERGLRQMEEKRRREAA